MLTDSIDSVKIWLDECEEWMSPVLVSDIRKVIGAVEFAAFQAPVVMAALDKTCAWSDDVLDSPIPVDGDWFPEDDTGPDEPIPYELAGLAKVMTKPLEPWGNISSKSPTGYPKGRGCSYRIATALGARLLVGTVVNCDWLPERQRWLVQIAAIDPAATQDLVTHVYVGANGVSECGNARVFGPHPFEAFSD